MLAGYPTGHRECRAPQAGVARISGSCRGLLALRRVLTGEARQARATPAAPDTISSPGRLLPMLRTLPQKRRDLNTHHFLKAVLNMLVKTLSDARVPEADLRLAQCHL
jgi:hypothetical protein